MLPAFTHAVQNSQEVFRCALTAISFPAQPQTCPVMLTNPCPQFSPALAALALSLCNGESIVWLSPAINTDDNKAWLRFHGGIHFTDSAKEADFLFVATPQEMPPLSLLNKGNVRYPDRSATLCLGGVSFEKSEQKLTAQGPGIQGTHIWHCSLSPQFIAERQENNQQYPLGIDMFVCDASRIAGLPRTTTLSMEKKALCM